MQYHIQTATTQQQREAIYCFRYSIYMEEFNKLHIPADHQNKMLFDDADKYSKLYYAIADKNIVATIRGQRGAEGPFTNTDYNFFKFSEFEKYIGHHKMAIVNRLMVDKEYRRSTLAHEMMLATYLGGLEVGTRLCFITCDDKLLPLYLRYGFRIYTESFILINGEKRNRLVLFLCDKKYLKKTNSPFLTHLPESLDDKGYYAQLVEEKVGFDLLDEIESSDSSSIIKNAS